MRDVKFTFLQRFATEDRVVDDKLVTFEVIRDGYRHFPVGSKVEMRLVHIFEMRDGRIARELVFDMGRASVVEGAVRGRPLNRRSVRSRVTPQ